MRSTTQNRWRVFWICFLAAALAVTVVQASTVNLIAYVTYSLLNSSGTPLPDGSIVMIFGSLDTVNDGLQTYGGTNLIADSTQGDDIYLGFVRIDMPSFAGSNGTFYTANEISFDDSVVQYLYLRFFDTANYPVTGYVAWGTSPVMGYTQAFGQAEVDFIGNYQVSMTNNFVVIPEPSTGNLLFLFMGVVFGLQAAMKRSAKRGAKQSGAP